MQKLAARQPELFLAGCILFGVLFGGLVSYLLTGHMSEGTSFGSLLGVAVGGLLTRQARPQFAIPLLLLLVGGIVFLTVIWWRASGV